MVENAYASLNDPFAVIHTIFSVPEPHENTSKVRAEFYSIFLTSHMVTSYLSGQVVKKL